MGKALGYAHLQTYTTQKKHRQTNKAGGGWGRKTDRQLQLKTQELFIIFTQHLHHRTLPYPTLPSSCNSQQMQPVPKLHTTFSHWLLLAPPCFYYSFCKCHLPSSTIKEKKNPGEKHPCMYNRTSAASPLNQYKKKIYGITNIGISTWKCWAQNTCLLQFWKATYVFLENWWPRLYSLNTEAYQKITCLIINAKSLCSPWWLDPVLYKCQLHQQGSFPFQVNR